MEEAFDTLMSKLQQAATAALQRQDFERVQEIMEAAKALKEFRSRFSNLLGAESSSSAETRPAERSRGLINDVEPEVQANNYPVFFVRDGALIKRALRSDKETTYDQRLPRANFDQVVEVLRSMLATKNEFHPSEVVSKADTPQYHVYMALHVLENAGFLDLIRRGLYRFLRTSETSWASGVWEDLPQGEG